MGKTMDKATVIYGANGSIGLGAVNWDQIKKAILDEIGDEPISTPLAGAKQSVEKAKNDKTLVKAYVKVGLVDGNLVLRIKDVRTLLDKEIDTILVKQFKQKKDAHEKMVALQAKGGVPGDKGVVVSLDPKDKVIKPSAESIATQRKLGEDGPLQRAGQTYGDKDNKHTGTVVDDEKLKKEAFSGSNNAPIVILAHGTPLGTVGSGKVHATEFGGKSASQIIEYLKKSLPVTYSGVVYLDGCYTAAGNTPLNFGKLVYDGMVKAGYFYLQVKGNLGMARTVNGKECVTHAEIEKAYEDAKKKKEEIDKQIPLIAKKYDDIRAGIINEMNELKKQAMLAGRVGVAKYTEDEKNKQNALMEREKANTTNKENDSKLKPLLAEQKRLQDLINAPKYNIEALTGTWGPEKLPPRA
jgi:hypothetical protein